MHSVLSNFCWLPGPFIHESLLAERPTRSGFIQISIPRIDGECHVPPCSRRFLHHPPKFKPEVMLRARAILRAQTLTRSYATASLPHALVFLEHNHGVIDPGSLSALTAATQLGGKVTGLIVGDSEQVNSVLDKAKKHVRLYGYLQQAQPTLHSPG